MHCSETRDMKSFARSRARETLKAPSIKAYTMNIFTESLIQELTESIGLSERTATALIGEYGELAVQRHAMYCLWMIEKGKVHNPPAWFTASLKGDWTALYGMPGDWLPTVLEFRVDENTFVQFHRELRQDKAKEE
jgi:hypothetical protein